MEDREKEADEYLNRKRRKEDIVDLIKEGYINFNDYFNGKILVVNAGTWNVRDKADISGKVVTVVKGGNTYKYTQILKNWAYIPSLRGWISSKGYTIKK